MTNAAIKQLIAQGVADALAEIEANRTSRNGDDSHDSGTGSKRTERAARECTYSDFLKCQSLNFKGTERVCSDVVEFHVKTVGHDAEYGMPGKTLKKMMTAKYCSKGEIKKLEIKLWNMKVKGTDVRSVMASKLKTMQDAMENSNDLMDQKIRTFAERQAENKRKLDNDNQAQQQPPKKQNVTIAYTVGNPATTNNQRTLTCYECGNQGHYRTDCLELKNRNHGNQAGGVEAHGMMYDLGGIETDQDINDMEDDINA
ncbi:hypothetical protein Tco_0392966 [Tanacetum coccineum]